MQSSSEDIVWLTWERQRRNVFIAKAIGAELLELDVPGGRFNRYWVSLRETYHFLRKQRPKVIFCQNPSVVLSVFSLLYAKIYNVHVCIDTHNAGLAIDGQNWMFRKIAVYLQRNADLIIVTNSRLKKIVDDNGGNAFVLPDDIPDIAKSSSQYPFSHEKNLLFICTYAPDEPFEEVFKAAEIVCKSGLDIGIYVTGKIPEHLRSAKLAANVHLLGFVSWNDFDMLLYSCDGIIDLTTREDCLVCGAYEAVSVSTPGILSDTFALREHFSSGFRFTNNKSENLAEEMIKLVDDLTRMKKDICDLKTTLKKQWEEKKSDLLKLIGSLGA